MQLGMMSGLSLAGLGNGGGGGDDEKVKEEKAKTEAERQKNAALQRKLEATQECIEPECYSMQIADRNINRDCDHCDPPLVGH